MRILRLAARPDIARHGIIEKSALRGGGVKAQKTRANICVADGEHLGICHEHAHLIAVHFNFEAVPVSVVAVQGTLCQHSQRPVPAFFEHQFAWIFFCFDSHPAQAEIMVLVLIAKEQSCRRGGLGEE